MSFSKLAPLLFAAMALVGGWVGYNLALFDKNAPAEFENAKSGVYVNAKYGFTFKYPKDLVVAREVEIDDLPPEPYATNQKFYVNIHSPANTEESYTFITVGVSRIDDAKLAGTPIEIAGETGRMAYVTDLNRSNSISAEWEHNGYQYSLVVSRPENDTSTGAIFNLIASSFMHFK